MDTSNNLRDTRPCLHGSGHFDVEFDGDDLDLADAVPADLSDHDEQVVTEDVFLDEEASMGMHNTLKNRPSNAMNILLFCFFSVLILGVTLTSVFLGGGNDDNADNSVEKQPPSLPPTLTDPEEAPPVTHDRDPTEVEGITTTITNQLGTTYFQQGSDYAPNYSVSHRVRNTALHWLLYQDPLQLKPSDDHLLQRFVLAVFYHQTTQQQPWKECNPPTGSQSDLCFYPAGGWHGDNPPMWGHRWLTNTHECLWGGLLCDRETKTVIDITMSFNGLNGPIPWELAVLTSLVDLNFRTNNFTGTIPEQLGELKQLNHVDLTRNQLTGTIPTDLFSRGPGDAPLMYLRLSYNQLNGSIPTEVGLMNGTYLSLSMNELTGSIPTELFHATSLTGLFLGDNPKITGSIPTQIGLLTNAHYFHLDYSGLTGTLPSEIGRMSDLIELNFTALGLEGTIPEEFYSQLKEMAYLDLSDCHLTGTISTRIGQMTELKFFHIDHNDLKGTLPSEMAALTDLLSIKIHGNNLEGSIPEAICSLSDSIPDHWRDFELIADCMPDASTGVAAIECPRHCCTTCCDSKTGICMVT